MAKVVSAGPSGDVSKWHTIYPQYLNSNLTVELGRRLAKSKCVPDPTTEEIYNVLSASSNFEVQAFPYKCYCREEDKENLKNRGYVKYLCNDPNLKKKRDVLAYVAMTIPKLKSRQNQKASEQKTSGGQTAPPIQSSNAGGGGKKKNRRNEEEPEEKARQKERARVEILKAKYGKPERIKSNDDNLEYDIVKLASQLQTCLKLLHQVPEEGDRPKAKRTMPVPSNIERTSDLISSAYDPCFSIGECQDKNKILRKQVVPKVKRSTLLHKLSNSDVISSSAVPHSTTITDDCLNKGKKGLSEKMLRKLVALKSKQPASSSNSSNIEPSIVVSKQFKSTSAGPIKFDNSTKGNRYCEQIHKKIKITSISGYLCNVKKLKKQSLL